MRAYIYKFGLADKKGGRAVIIPAEDSKDADAILSKYGQGELGLHFNPAGMLSLWNNNARRPLPWDFERAESLGLPGPKEVMELEGEGFRVTMVTPEYPFSDWCLPPAIQTASA